MHNAIFVHLPKSGGTSAIKYFISCLGESKVCETHTLPQSDTDCVSLKSKSILLAGHFRVRDLSRSLIEHFKVFTIIRDPIDASLSNYYFRRHSPDLDHLLPDYTIELCREKELHEALLAHQHLDLSAFGNPVTEQLSLLSISASLSEHFQSAVEVLNSLDAVGLFENFQESIQLICALMNWPLAGEVPHLNKSPARLTTEDLPKETVALLKKMNQADLELYAIAAERFNKELKGTKTLSPSTKRVVDVARPTPKPSEIGSKDLSIEEISIIGGNTSSDSIVEVTEGSRVTVRYKIAVTKPHPDLTVGISIRDEEGVIVLATNTRLINYPVPTLGANEKFNAYFSFQQFFMPGRFYVSASLHKGFAHTEGCFHLFENAAEFSVVRNEFRNVLNSRQTLGVDFGIVPISEITELPKSVAELVNVRVVAGPNLGFTKHLWVLIENSSSYWIHSEGPFPVHISYKATTSDGVQLSDEPRTRIEPPLEPYGKRIYLLNLSPNLTADHTLKISLVQEGKFWFYLLNPDHGQTFTSRPQAAIPHREMQIDKTNLVSQHSMSRVVMMETISQHAEARATLAEMIAKQAEARVIQAEAKTKQTETNVVLVETIAQKADVRAVLAETIAQQIKMRSNQTEASARQAADRAILAETMAQQAEARAAQAESIAHQTVTRAIQAETSAQMAEELASLAEMTAQDAEARAIQAESTAQQTESRAVMVEASAKQAESRAVLAEANARHAENRAVLAEANAKQAEDRAVLAETTAQQSEALSTEAETRAQVAAARAEQAAAYARQSEARAVQAETAAFMSVAQLQVLQATKSWRATAPLRWSYKMIRYFSKNKD